MIFKVYDNLVKLIVDKNNNVISSNDFLKTFVTSYDKRKIYNNFGKFTKSKIEKIEEPLYVIEKETENEIIYDFSITYLNLIPKEIKSKLNIKYYNSKSLLTEKEIKDNIKNIKTILQPEFGFDLRQDQIIAVIKSLFCKRGIIQLGTGAGKTAIMSAIIKFILKYSKKKNIKVLVLEPTEVLVENTINTFRKYKIDAVNSKKSNLNDDNVIVSCPMSMVNWLEDKNNNNKIDIVFWDECQHCSCETYRILSSEIRNTQYAIGLSALAVNQERIQENDIKKLKLSEAIILGATGKVILNLPSSYYIKKGILSTPVILQLQYKVSSYLRGEKNWQKLNKDGIQNNERNKLIAKVTYLFNYNKRKVLILVATKKQGYQIANYISQIVINDKCLRDHILIAYGSHEQKIIDPKDSLKQIKYDGKDGIDDFDKGKFSIMIATNHVDEGVDLKNLDAVILASGGKKDRRIIQRVGRALRKTKTGKYAYVIDFSDEGNGILHHHANLRLDLYRNLISVPKNLIFTNLNIKKVKDIFYKLENLDDKNI